MHIEAALPIVKYTQILHTNKLSWIAIAMRVPHDLLRIRSYKISVTFSMWLWQSCVEMSYECNEGIIIIIGNVVYAVRISQSTVQTQLQIYIMSMNAEYRRGRTRISVFGSTWIRAESWITFI